MALVVPYLESIQYDGTNGTYIIDTWLDGAVTLVSDTGTVLTWENFEESETHVNLDGWVLRTSSADQSPSARTNAQYLAMYVELP